MCRGSRTGPAVVLVLLAAGCSAPQGRLNAPPQGSSERAHPLQEHFVYMQDNALLSDMCFSDVHFVPHTPELNGLGVRRLKRYAKLLAHYGGKLQYDTELSDGDPLIQARLGNAAEFLELCGLDPDRFEVIVGAPAGRGMSAKEAIAGRQASAQSAKERRFGSVLTSAK